MEFEPLPLPTDARVDRIDTYGRPLHPQYKKLAHALETKTYPTIYAELKKLPPTLCCQDAYILAYRALDCTPAAFSALLEHCPQELFCFDHDQKISSGGTRFYSICSTLLGPHPDLLAVAAWKNKIQHMEMLLDHGMDINAHHKDGYSPLEAALIGRSTKCVDLLIAQPNLQQPMTPLILDFWAQLDNVYDTDDYALDFCIQSLANYFYPDASFELGTTPLPPELTLTNVLKHGNWNIACQLCSSRSISKQEAEKTLDSLTISCFNGHPAPVAQMVGLLFDQHPSLMQKKHIRSLLAAACLSENLPPENTLFDEGEAHDFTPCQILVDLVHRLPGKSIKLTSLPEVQWGQTSLAGLLPRWNDILGDRFTPVVDRNHLPDSLYHDDEFLSFLFDDLSYKEEFNRVLQSYLKFCSIRGKISPNTLSPLAKDMLQYLDIPTLIDLLSHDTVLTEEYPEALLRFVTESRRSREQVSAILAYIPSCDNHYDL